jgi:hypothetical protein
VLLPSEFQRRAPGEARLPGLRPVTLVPKVADSVVGGTVVIASAGFPPTCGQRTPVTSSQARPVPTAIINHGPDVCGGPVRVRWYHQRRRQYRYHRRNGTRGRQGWTCNDVDGNYHRRLQFNKLIQGRGNFRNILLKITKDGGNSDCR